MAKFEEAYKLTKKNEGGYVNNPQDLGGETYNGISRKNWPDWIGWKYIDEMNSIKSWTKRKIEIKTMLDDWEAEFYKENFWDVHLLDEMNNQKIANELFDTSVNIGVRIAATFLQRSINVTNRNGRDGKDVKVDGKCGPGTIDAVNTHRRQHNVLKAMNILQGARYIEIAEKNGTQESFINGWFERVSL